MSDVTDDLDCKSPSACARCHHFMGGACELEAAVNAYESALDAPARPAVPVALAWQAPEPRATA